ncbi:hypothetical protein B0T11DRAFT_290317 [Plectosphaerella cucumerina]|uniref:Uncharacterized protein n=1 Tax=Plectosphaerella cucumerina TaxID=40658 RepID=A0A8K0WZ08_9PEZI|nr:hypothetical protein B0T11DRAFT_290317 [Plectosphaerella cucumerina]
MPTGRASTVASSRSPSAERGRSERRRSSPDSRRSSRLRSSPASRRSSRLRSSPDSRRSSRPRSSRDARRSSRPHSTRSARSRQLVSPPPRQVSPVSTQATVWSDDFVPNQDSNRGRHHRDVEDDVSSLSSDDAEVPGGGQDVQSNAAVRQSPEPAPLAAGRRNEGNQTSHRPHERRESKSRRGSSRRRKSTGGRDCRPIVVAAALGPALEEAVAILAEDVGKSKAPADKKSSRGRSVSRKHERRHTLKADAGISMGHDGEEDEGPQPPQPLHQGGGVYEADRLSRKSSYRSGVVEADK